MHTHTNFSDGHNSPCALVRLAKSKGINALGITDHDSIEGIDQAIECGKEYGIEIIPGVELSTDVNDKEVHILGYFLDYNDEDLKNYLEFFRKERAHRARRIVKKLNSLGLKIDFDQVLLEAKNSAIGRPHIANVMIENNLASNYQEAFQKYLGDYAPAYERKIHVSLKSAIKLINDSKGLAFLAHPGKMPEDLLQTILASKIDGIEVVHPSHSESRTKFYRGLANQYCLLASGGSDFHGGIKHDEDNLGKYVIPFEWVSEIKSMTHQPSY
jgi:predicted metal-dependent phosphoesterase TrpH